MHFIQDIVFPTPLSQTLHHRPLSHVSYYARLGIQRKLEVKVLQLETLRAQGWAASSHNILEGPLRLEPGSLHW